MGMLPEVGRVLTRLTGRVSLENPDWNMGLAVKVVPLSIEVTGNTRLALFVLLGSVCLVLLIACVNVANLILSRVHSEHENSPCVLHWERRKLA
jgi:hypothetical protein